MKSSIALTLAAAKLITAHTTFQSLVVDGKDQGQHFAVRTPSNGNNPIYDVSSDAMICNGGASTSDFVEVKAGSTLGMQWHHNDPMTVSGDNDEPIAESHHGPVMVYIAPADSNGEGAVWTKISEDGLEGGAWGTDRFRDNAGLVEVTLPDLADGEYLIRPEMIGLHEATGEAKAQFYNGCGQLKITGGSTALPSTGVDMTKVYSPTDAGVLVNIYPFPETYSIPGPEVWDGASSGSAPSTPSTPSTPTTSSPAASSSAVTVPSATASAMPSAAPSAAPSAVPVEPVDTAPSYGSGSGSAAPAMPKTFTMKQFIKWLKTSAKASGVMRRHAREFKL